MMRTQFGKMRGFSGAVVLVFTAVMLSLPAHARTLHTNFDYFRLQQPKIRLDSELSGPRGVVPRSGMSTMGLEADNLKGCDSVPNLNLFELGPMGVSAVFNPLDVAWSLIQSGKPIIHAEPMSAAALPVAASCWDQLAGWKQPMSRVYTVTYSNFLGIQVVRFRYRIFYVYGGNYDGIGSYIASVQAVPSDVRLSWGFNLDASAQVPMVYNAGTTKKPVGALQLNMSWTVSSLVRSMEKTRSYLVEGDGTFRTLH